MGATYRVLEYLQREGLVERDGERGPFAVPDWQRLLRAWSDDFSLLEDGVAHRYFEPRGLDVYWKRVANGNESRYAVTGSAAASELAPFAPVRTAVVWVDDARSAAAAWNLRETETAPNVLLLEPRGASDIVFTNTRTSSSGLTLAAPAQVAIDLLTGPGRNPSEGEELISWMAVHEKEWRR